jgi:copper transport protein
MSRGALRRGARLAVVGVAAGWLLCVAAAPASAHALLESSRPAANATLTSAPTDLSLTFTEPPDPSLSSVRLIASNGTDVALGRPRTSGRTIDVAVTGTLGDGTYTVDWRVVSRTDGHVTAGSFAFGVGVEPSPAPGGERASGTAAFPSAGSVVAKWLLYVGLSVVVAAAVVGVAALRRPRPAPRIVVGGALAALAGALALVASETSTIGVGVGTFLGSAAGRPYAWLVAATAATLALAVGWLFSARTAALMAAAGAAALAMLLRAIGGHADAGRFPALEVFAQFAHFAAAGVWIGGLAWLMVLLPSVVPAERGVYVRRFSTVAGVALCVVAVTGVVRAIDEIGGPSHLGRLVSTDYGWTLLVKVVVAAALVAGGAWNRYVNVPRSANGGTGLGRVATGELVLAAAVFALTGVLTGLPPDVSVPAAVRSQPAALTVTGSDFATTVRTRLVVTPGTVGSNRFELHVADYDTGRPIDAERLTLRLSAISTPTLASSTVRLHEVREGTWAATSAAMSIDDRWRVAATIETSSGSTQLSMEMSPGEPTGRTTRSTAAGQPTLFTTRFADGGSIQSYLDPGTPGPNQLHVTVFDRNGHEVALHHVSLIAIPPDGPSVALEALPFSQGHYAGNVELTAGTWTFEIRTLTHAAVSLDARFSQRIGGPP